MGGVSLLFLSYSCFLFVYFFLTMSIDMALERLAQKRGCWVVGLLGNVAPDSMACLLGGVVALHLQRLETCPHLIASSIFFPASYVCLLTLCGTSNHEHAKPHVFYQ